MHVPFSIQSVCVDILRFPVLSNMTKSVLQLSTGRKKFCMVFGCCPTHRTPGQFRITMTAYAISTYCN